MKYIKLYEAFESSTISSIIRFLKSKFYGNKYKLFIDSLKSMLLNVYDIQLSKIKDDNIGYLRSSKAMSIKKPDGYEISNKFGIYCLKFFFTIEDGYIGVIASGNKRERYVDDNLNFEIDDEIYHYIVNELGIKTGIMKLPDFDKMKDGDEYIGLFDSYYSRNKSRIALSKLFIDDGDRLLFIQNVAHGGNPRGPYEDYGRCSWSIGRIGNISRDDTYNFLYKYENNDDPLKVEGYNYHPEVKENIFDYNFPISPYGGKQESWSKSSSDYKDNLENSDFAIVFYLDDILKDDVSVSDIKKNRKDKIDGALSLEMDVDIRRSNIDRYINKSLKKYGIGVDGVRLKDLQRFFNSILCGDYSMYVLYEGIPIEISRLLYNINTLMDYLSRSDKYTEGINDTYLEIKDIYIKGINKSINRKDIYIYNYNMIKKSIDPNLKNHKLLMDYINIYMNVGDHISKNILSNEISSIQDYTILYHKLRTIYELLNDSSFIPKNSSISYIISLLKYKDDGRIIDQIKKINESDDVGIEMKSDIEKLKKLSNYTKSII